MAARLPEPPQRMDEADRLLRATAADRALERRAEIVMLGLEEIEPAFEVLSVEVRRRVLGEREVRRGMAVLDGLALVARRQPLEREIPDRDEHPDPRLA